MTPVEEFAAAVVAGLAVGLTVEEVVAAIRSAAEVTSC